MPKTKLISALTLGLFLAAAAHAADAKKITGLKTPESAVVGKDGRIYVSEINEAGKDGDGQISVDRKSVV